MVIIPSQLFETPKKILLLQVPFCEANEKRSKNFLNKFYDFTNEKFRLIIRWKTRKLNLFFPLKIKTYILHARFTKGFVVVNQPMSVKQSGMWRLDIRNTIILVGSLNHQNIYIRISTMCLPVQLFALHQKLIEHEKILKRFI